MRGLVALRGKRTRPASLHAAPSTVVKPLRTLESPVSLEGKVWGTLQIGDNRVVIGLVKRVPCAMKLFDVEKKRVGSDKLTLSGRMASPHWYCRIRDRFEMIRPE
jgi:flavin reductase (DIM6/NTAB) family NADH-FMN oxidoreductase RutF